jgi:hypothetical protein
MGYGLDGCRMEGSIFGRGKKFVSSPHLDQLWGLPSFLFEKVLGAFSPGVKQG